MSELLDYVQETDFSGQALEVVYWVNAADPGFLGVLVALAVCLGHKMALGHRMAYALGLRLGVLTLLGHGGYTIFKAGGFATSDLPHLLGRSFLWAGIVLALAWIVLPFFLFVVCYFRHGLIGFVGYGVYGLVTAESLENEALTGIAWRGLLVAGLTMVIAWVLQPVFDFFATRWPAKAPAPSPPPAGEDSRLTLLPSASVTVWEDPALVNLKRLHGWYLEEERRLQMLDIDMVEKQTKLLVLQEMYVSLSQRFVQEERIDVVPVLPYREPQRLKGRAICSA